jgi:Cft2 family RNA processing exonuclease
MSDVAGLFEYHRGLHLRDTPLWLDADERRELCFVSHALVAGAGRQKKMLTTDATARILRALATTYGRGRRVHEPQVLVTPFGRTFSLGNMNLEFFPAGYVLGSASLLINHRGLSIVYAGQVNPAPSSERLVEQLEARHCDVLVLPCRLGAQRLALPPAEEVRAQLLRYVHSVLDEGGVPVLLCSVVGEAQALVRLLGGAGIALRGHRKIRAVCDVYDDLQPGAFGEAAIRHHAGPIAPESREVLLWPADLGRSPAVEKQPAARIALVSSLARDPSVPAEMGCEAAFPLGMHPDYRGVLEYVHACAPTTVVLTGSYSDELAADLQAQGLSVISVGPRTQLQLL